MNCYVGKCTIPEEEKANVTNTHIYIPAFCTCSYTHTHTNMQAMVDVQYLWDTYFLTHTNFENIC